ncbi:lantibiotic dehydratase [Streptomyces sp. NPDC003032]
MAEAVDGPVFEVAGPVLVRAPVLPADRVRSTWQDLDPDDTPAATEYLAALMEDPLVREAVQVSSPALGERVEQMLGGRSATPRQVRRAVLSLSRYVLRMACRPTPFGMMAGVAAARFGDTAHVAWGPRDRRWVRPDAGWLAQLVSRWEEDPLVLPHLRLVANDVCFARGGRWVMPCGVTDEDGVPRCAEESVRHTPAVQAAVELVARRPLTGQAVIDALRLRFPGTPTTDIGRLLTQLVRHRMLLADLAPAPQEADPLGHVLRRLTECGGQPAQALQDLERAVQGYATAPWAAGSRACRALGERMRALHAVDRPLQVDLALDADVRLPHRVAREAERAAEVLWRIAPSYTAPGHLRQYHAQFLERYGTAHAVPLARVLDPDMGLGPPAGYLWPPRGYSGEEPLPPEPAPPDRQEALGALLAGALHDGAQEVVLTEADVRALEPPGRGPVAPSMELCAQLMAVSSQALDAGHFGLVLSSGTGSTLAGAMLGRFAYLLDPPVQEDAAQMARATGTTGAKAVPVNLVWPPPLARARNVCAAPAWLPHTLAIGVFCDSEQPVLRLDDLSLAADTERLLLVSRRLGREVVPLAWHMLHPAAAPNAARLAREVGQMGARHCRPWSWGPLAVLPYLPRVRYRRTVLASAQWRLAYPPLRERGLPHGDWARELERWRRRWAVPEHVLLGSADRRIEVNLADRLHQELVRQELWRTAQSVLYETPQRAAGLGDGWLQRAGRAHTTEIVIPLRARPRAATATARPSAAPVPSRRTPVAAQLPGGRWLYAKIYGSCQRQNLLLRDLLPHLLDELPPEVDRWYFLRYADPAPHLRLRFSGPADALRGRLLPALHDWAVELRRQGLAQRMTLDTYEPECARYGGPEALEHAERAFCADSHAVLAQLRLLHTTAAEVDPVLLAAVNFLDIARHTCPTSPDWSRWLLHAVPKEAEDHRAVRALRHALAGLLHPADAHPQPHSLPGGSDLARVFTQRAPALARYRQAAQAATAVTSLLHMHHNRLLGSDRGSEGRALAIARGALEAHHQRRQHRP